MAFRFNRRVKILPGISLNFSKSGITTSIGQRGAKLNLGGKRGPRATIGVPGTGVSYTVTAGAKAAGGGRPTKGYKLGKVVICPRCKSMAPYDPAMVGEQLHCPKCDHMFYLGHNVKDAWLPPIVKCKKCGVLIEKSAKQCPVCGAKNKNIGCIGCLLYLLLAFFALGMIGGMLQAIMGK